MAYRNLDEFIARLEQSGDVDSHVFDLSAPPQKTTARLSPKVQLFEYPQSGVRVVGDLFATQRHIEQALRVESLDEIAARLDALLSLGKSGAFGSIVTQAMSLFSTLRTNTNRVAPKSYELLDFDVWKARIPVFLSENTAFHATAILGMPDEGLRPVMVNILPGTIRVQGAPAVGDGEAVTLVFGGDPAYILAAMTPLPDMVHRTYFASWLRGRPLELMRLPALDVEVPSNADVIVVGRVCARSEGGPNHFYDIDDAELTLSVSAVWSLPRPVYLTWTLHENHVVRDAIKQIFRPLIDKLLPREADIEQYLAHLKRVWLHNPPA